RQYKLIAPATAAAVTIDASGLVLATNNGTVTIPATDEQLGTQHVALQGHALAKPGNTITWAVDRLRAFAWFGDENMQRLKAVTYRVWDLASRWFGLGVGGESAEFALLTPEQSSAPHDAAPATGDLPEELRRPWPPRPLTPLISPAEADEGRWLSLNNDPFINPSDDPAGLFYTTFIRTDPERTYARIIVT